MLHPNEIKRYQSISQSINQSNQSINQSNQSINQCAVYLASRWAVKEAAVKASGVRLIFPDMEIVRSINPQSLNNQSINHQSLTDQPISDQSVSHQSINQSIKVSLADYDPRPKLILTGESLSMCNQLNIDNQSVQLSLSHDGEYAIAYIIMMQNQSVK